MNLQMTFLLFILWCMQSMKLRVLTREECLNGVISLLIDWLLKQERRERNINLLFYLLTHSFIGWCMCPDYRWNSKPWCIQRHTDQHCYPARTGVISLLSDQFISECCHLMMTFDSISHTAGTEITNTLIMKILALKFSLFIVKHTLKICKNTLRLRNRILALLKPCALFQL